VLDTPPARAAVVYRSFSCIGSWHRILELTVEEGGGEINSTAGINDK